MSLCTDLVFIKSPFKNAREILEFYCKYLRGTLCKREYYFIKFLCNYFLGKIHTNSFTESSSPEIIEDNQVISEKYCEQKDRYR